MDSAAGVAAVDSADPPDLLADAALVRDSGGHADFRIEGFRVRGASVASMAAGFAGAVVTFGALTGTSSTSASTASAIPITPMTISTRTIIPTPIRIDAPLGVDRALQIRFIWYSHWRNRASSDVILKGG
jgi:hypothetical protein